MVRYIDIKKESIPYRFDIKINNRTYTFEVNYNAEHDFFTVDLYYNDTALVIGEKLIYGKPLFSATYDSRFPEEYIIPLDVSETANRITFDNMNVSILLYIFSQEELSDAQQS